MPARLGEGPGQRLARAGLGPQRVQHPGKAEGQPADERDEVGEEPRGQPAVEPHHRARHRAAPRAPATGGGWWPPAASAPSAPAAAWPGVPPAWEEESISATRASRSKPPASHARPPGHLAPHGGLPPSDTVQVEDGRPGEALSAWCGRSSSPSLPSRDVRTRISVRRETMKRGWDGRWFWGWAGRSPRVASPGRRRVRSRRASPTSPSTRSTRARRLGGPGRWWERRQWRLRESPCPRTGRTPGQLGPENRGPYIFSRPQPVPRERRPAPLGVGGGPDSPDSWPRSSSSTY